MSLETIERKILSTGKLPFWKFLIFYGLLPSTITLSISYTFVPFIFAESQTFGVKVLALLSLSAFYMIVSFAVILTSVGILRGLSKLSTNLNYHTSNFIGNLLSINDEFLRKFANGVFPKLIGFIRGYNDPKIEELQQGSLRQQTEIDEIKQRFQNQINELKKWTQTQFDKIVQDFVRQIGILQLKLDKSERRRINAESELKSKNDELKIWRKVTSDVSFRIIHQQKELDKFQTRLDEF